MASRSTMTTRTAVLVTEPASVAALNRGPITSLFSLPSTCLATLTLDTRRETLVAIHGVRGYFDANCFPTGTLQPEDLAPDSVWHSYYCSSLPPPLHAFKQPPLPPPSLTIIVRVFSFSTRGAS